MVKSGLHAAEGQSLETEQRYDPEESFHSYSPKFLVSEMG
jgi:hypothetical protein